VTERRKRDCGALVFNEYAWMNEYVWTSILPVHLPTNFAKCRLFNIRSSIRYVLLKDWNQAAIALLCRPSRIRNCWLEMPEPLWKPSTCNFTFSHHLTPRDTDKEMVLQNLAGIGNAVVKDWEFQRAVRIWPENTYGLKWTETETSAVLFR